MILLQHSVVSRLQTRAKREIQKKKGKEEIKDIEKQH
jgi:hypothetical protein